MTDTAFSDQTDCTNVKTPCLNPMKLRHAVLKGCIILKTAGRKNLGSPFKASCNIFGIVGIGADGDDLASKLFVALNDIRAGI